MSIRWGCQLPRNVRWRSIVGSVTAAPEDTASATVHRAMALPSAVPCRLELHEVAWILAVNSARHNSVSSPPRAACSTTPASFQGTHSRPPPLSRARTNQKCRSSGPASLAFPDDPQIGPSGRWSGSCEGGSMEAPVLELGHGEPGTSGGPSDVTALSSGRSVRDDPGRSLEAAPLPLMMLSTARSLSHRCLLIPVTRQAEFSRCLGRGPTAETLAVFHVKHLTGA